MGAFLSVRHPAMPSAGSSSSGHCTSPSAAPPVLHCPCQSLAGYPTAPNSVLKVWVASQSLHNGVSLRGVSLRAVTLANDFKSNTLPFDANHCYIALLISAVCHRCCSRSLAHPSMLPPPLVFDPFIERVLYTLKTTMTEVSLNSTAALSYRQVPVSSSSSKISSRLAYEVHLWEGLNSPVTIQTVARSVVASLGADLHGAPASYGAVDAWLQTGVQVPLPLCEGGIFFSYDPNDSNADAGVAATSAFRTRLRELTNVALLKPYLAVVERSIPVNRLTPRTVSAVIAEKSSNLSALGVSPRCLAAPRKAFPQQSQQSTMGGQSSFASGSSSSSTSSVAPAPIVAPLNIRGLGTPISQGSSRSSSGGSSNGWIAKKQPPTLRRPPFVPPLPTGQLAQRGEDLSPGRASSARSFGVTPAACPAEVDENWEKMVWEETRIFAAAARDEEEEEAKNDQPVSKASLLRQYQGVCTEVIPRLFISGSNVASDWQLLQSNRITHVINLASDSCFNSFPHSIIYVNIVLQDSRLAAEGFQAVLLDTLEMIDAVLRTSAHSLLVHCREGVSRSAAVVAAYIMWKARVSFDTALAALRSRRRLCNPNTGFTFALLRFQRALRLVTDETEFEKESAVVAPELCLPTPAETSACCAPQQLTAAIVEEELTLWRESFVAPERAICPFPVNGRRLMRAGMQDVAKGPFLVWTVIASYDPTHNWWPEIRPPLLDPRCCYILRDAERFWFWVGDAAAHPRFQLRQFLRNFLRQTCRFERLRLEDVTVSAAFQSRESAEFWQVLGGDSSLIGHVKDVVPLQAEVEVLNFNEYCRRVQTGLINWFSRSPPSKRSQEGSQHSNGGGTPFFVGSLCTIRGDLPLLSLRP